ncbi:TetR/AcrR family transcriptional regulator [Kineococcus sp. SYSU DK006]|uniref:TetR/AcrR family transcriptional regulator n=1 Tax=Kineococcus sp. SYSU DK006 TaxID=3383127 RepID=UPI003D7DD96B
MDARQRLIETTRELLHERGYVGTSPRAVQERAGVGQGSMYHHFAGKADLARTALERTAALERERAEALLGDASVPPADRVVAYLRRERDALRGCPVGRHTQDPDVLADDGLRSPVEQTFAWLRQRIAGLLAQAQQEGSLRAEADPAAVAAAVAAVVQGGYVLARAAASPEPAAAAADGAVAMLEALRTPPRAPHRA